MKLSSTVCKWQPTPFQFTLQVKTNDVEARRVREKLMTLLASADHLNEDLSIRKASQNNDAVRLVHWLAVNLDTTEKQEIDL